MYVRPHWVKFGAGIVKWEDLGYVGGDSDRKLRYV
jgi:hypothetical protein